MSREPIRMTSKERQVASDAAAGAIAKGKHHYGVVAAVVNAINHFREGDRTGTIRRDPATGEVWVCIHHGSDNWHGVAVTGYTIWTDDEGVEGFPIIYTPEDS